MVRCIIQSVGQQCIAGIIDDIDITPLSTKNSITIQTLFCNAFPQKK